MMIKNRRVATRYKRHRRIRKRVMGTAQRLRLNVFRSLKHIHVQIIDDVSRVTRLTVSSLSPEFKGKFKNGGNILAAEAVGALAGEKALALGIKEVVFDRGGYLYHGRIKALADAARKAGLQF